MRRGQVRLIIYMTVKTGLKISLSKNPGLGVYMNQRVMRRTFAIVFSLLLVIGQWASAMPSAPQRLATACDDCSCKMMACCVAQAPTSQETAPQAPAPETRASEQLLLTALAASAALLAEPISTALPSGKITVHAPSAPAVPLYCQNCIFLI